MNSDFETVLNFLNSSNLPDCSVFSDLLKTTGKILVNESTFYRDSSDDGLPGSLLDFQGQNLPTIVVPDLHARPFFLENILKAKLPKEFLLKNSTEFWNGDIFNFQSCENENLSVFEALSKKRLRIICVGDALHTEKRTRCRWMEAFSQFEQGNFISDAMICEMSEGLALLCGLMKLKELFPENFHFLKGNHENILNVSGGGDFSFGKYVNEGQMVFEFIKKYYGNEILYQMSYVEHALPLIAVTSNIVVSHAEPKSGFSREQLVNAHFSAEIILALTWTDNNTADENSVMEIIENLSVNLKPFEIYRYIGGHRPVNGKFELRQNGLFVQIHNPIAQNVALVYCNRRFNPETDIISVNNQQI